MTKATPSGKGGIVTVHTTEFFKTNPGILGFNNLVEPEDPFGDGLRFALNLHQEDAGRERLIELLDPVLEDLRADFIKAAKQASKNPPGGEWHWPSARLWVEDHTKQPKEESKQQLAHIQFANKAEFTDREHVTHRKTIRAYDAKGNLVNLPALHMGYGSIVKVIVRPGLFISPVVKQPQPSLQLQGVQIIALKQFGGGASGPVGAVSEDELEGLGDVEVDDLSAYLGTSSTMKPSAAPQNDLDDELPF